MIEIHILIPVELAAEIEGYSSNQFVITQRLFTASRDLKFFRVNTTEEDVTALVLKYGKDKVWIR